MAPREKNKLGIYIHVPFCKNKCPYCDFYSITSWDNDLMDKYTQKVISLLNAWHEKLDNPIANTLYFGGGTPSLLGGKRIAKIVKHARYLYGLDSGEITMEANPSNDLSQTFKHFASQGGNRVSIGMQSVDQNDLQHLGRTHTHVQTQNACNSAISAGIENISLDIMLAIGGLHEKTSISQTITQAKTMGAKHLSAYILKVERGTPYYEQLSNLHLPDDDTQADIYLETCHQMQKNGYEQYEISNFCLNSYQSRHNLKYWNCDEVIGIGPSAHSFINSKRLYYDANLHNFLSSAVLRQDENTQPTAGSAQEYMMLRLRLSQGIDFEKYKQKFDEDIDLKIVKKAKALPPELVITDQNSIRFTSQGFLLSNALTAKILY